MTGADVNLIGIGLIAALALGGLVLALLAHWSRPRGRGGLASAFVGVVILLLVGGSLLLLFRMSPYERNLRISAASADVSLSPVEDAITEAIAKLRRDFTRQEPNEPAPTLIVLNQGPDEWVCEDRLARVSKALAERGLPGSIVFESEASSLPDARYEVTLEFSGCEEEGVLSAECVGVFPDEKSRTIRTPAIRYEACSSSVSCVSRHPVVARIVGGGVLALLVVLAYVFVDAGTGHRYTWAMRIGAAAAFTAVCVVVSRVGLPI
jgi:hypothetical protein